MSGFWKQFPSHRLLAEISLWSARLAFLGDDIRHIEPFADIYHIDVTDAQFVPGLLFFPDLVAAIRPLTQKPLHVHLMVNNPLALIDDFAAAGANLITIHTENGNLVEPALERIRELGVLAGLAILLETPVEVIAPYLDRIDIVTLMGTKLGIKGVGLDDRACSRLRQMKHLLWTHKRTDRIKVAADGGIRTNTVPALRAAGTDTVVMGSLAFKSSDLKATFQWLHTLPPPDEAGATEC